MTIPQLAGHTWNFQPRFNLERDALSVLDGLRDAGCSCFEGFLDHAPLYRGHLEERGLRMVACHAVTPVLHDIRSVVARANSAQVKDLCVSGLLDWWQRSPNDYRAAARLLNSAGSSLRGEGIWLHYHNHEFEFERQNIALSGMEVLAGALDFDVVSLCLDVGWAQRGGAHPVELLQKYQRQIGWVHLRDFQDEHSVELGQGEVDLLSIAALLPTLANLRGLAIEQDAPTDPVQSLYQSLRFWHEIIQQKN